MLWKVHQDKEIPFAHHFIGLSGSICSGNFNSVCFSLENVIGTIIILVQYKIWLKPAAEQQFLYGNHIMKSGLGRISESTSKYQGVVVYNMADIPLVYFLRLICNILIIEICCFQGFGVAAKATSECRHADAMTIVCFHQADVGQYIRAEDTLLG